MSKLSLWCALFCAGVSAVWSAPTKVADGVWTEPELPAWVVAPAAPQAPDDLSDDTTGLHQLVVDSQVRVEGQEEYAYRAYLLTNDRGVEQNGDVQFSFDPYYQELFLHRLQIRRGDEVIDLLPTQKFFVSVQEGSREYLTYDNSVTVEALLNQVQVGDIVEYAYRIVGENPVTQGRYGEWWSQTFSVPVEYARVRTLWPADRGELNWRLHGPDVGIELEQDKLPSGETVYGWEQGRTPLVVYEEDTPYDYDPRTYVQFSDWPDWPSVSRWAENLIDWEAPLPDTLQPLLAEWRKLPNEEAKVAAALSWVQREIRYVAIPMGEHNYRPYPVETIVERRFGDCKDKSQLLTRLLWELGIDAVPVLVDTSAGSLVKGYLPGPGAFDHVITHVQGKDREYWVDPTSYAVEGPLTKAWCPDYGWGLPIRGNSELVRVPGQGGEAWKSVSIETYVMDDYGTDIRLSVQTIFDGQSALQMANRMKGQTLSELGDDYLNYYADSFPEITADRLPEVSEIRADGTVEITEAYTIQNAWQPSEDETVITVQFYPSYLADHLFLSNQRIRKSPMELSYPLNVEQRITLVMPEAGDFPAEEEKIETKWFEYSATVKPVGSDVRIVYAYRNLVDRVEADDMAEYRKALTRVQNSLGYPIQYATGGTRVAEGAAWHEKFYWPAVTGWFVGGVMGFGLFLWLILRRKVPPLPPIDPEQDGITSWLILVSIGVIVRPFIIAATMITTADALFWENIWVLASPDSPQHVPAFGMLLAAEGFINFLMIWLSLALIVTFFCRRAVTRWLYPTVVLSNLVVLLADAAVVQALLGEYADASDSLPSPAGAVFGVVFSIYMIVSTRAKSTFRR
ncbi:MAG: DUF3857 domain-containing protein [Verrucomicrobiota bacterium JB022]|nr:DUF3857 domain-containing protein [Verrucomicrobiota bacterium JB022]